jgi:hypothetical protein
VVERQLFTTNLRLQFLGIICEVLLRRKWQVLLQALCYSQASYHASSTMPICHLVRTNQHDISCWLFCDVISIVTTQHQQ